LSELVKAIELTNSWLLAFIIAAPFIDGVFVNFVLYWLPATDRSVRVK